MRNITIFAGSSHPKLTEAICDSLGIQPGKCSLSKFSNRETNVQIGVSVRQNDCYIVQSGCGNINDNFMEMLIMISGCKIASARKVVAVIPCFPYARQPETPYKRGTAPLNRVPVEEMDKFASMFGAKDFSNVVSPREVNGNGLGLNGEAPNEQRSNHIPLSMVAPSPARSRHPSATADGPLIAERPSDDAVVTKLSAAVSPTTSDQSASAMFVPGINPTTGYKHWAARSGTLIANLLMCAGADHIITMDLHDPQFQGFFDIPVDNLFSQPLIIRFIKEEFPDYKNAIIVSPDAGGAKRATAIADRLGCDFALIHKDRRRTTTGGADSLILVGEVRGKTCIMVDDIADTCLTLTKAARVLVDNGATRIAAIVTHGIMSGDAVERIRSSAIDELIVSNTVPQEGHLEKLGSRLRVFDVAPLFAEAIRRVHNGESLSLLFENMSV